MREISLHNCRLDKRYDVREQIGRGSYAELFVARDIMASPNSPHSLVVIKALNVFLQNDLDPDLERTLVENFQNEAIALDRVRHPNILSRLGHGTARDLRGTMFHYLVLEYLAGGDLQKACREKTLTLKTALNYLEQVCAGLRHAHRSGIIHRDIKPQNLLLTSDRRTVKIADFGVARVHQSDAPITRVGTNIYAPPEHSPLFSETESVMTVAILTPAADIYSLAKSAYTLLTGEAPRFFANQPITDLPITALNEDWAPELKRVLQKATSRDPGHRHQSVDEFWADLEGVRRIAAESETTTHVRPKLHQVPQSRVTLGYTPNAPLLPKFDTSRNLKLNQTVVAGDSPIMNGLEEARSILDEPMRPTMRVESYWPNSDPAEQPKFDDKPFVIPEVSIDKPKKKRKLYIRTTAFVVFLAIFAGVLYGTSVYLRGLGIIIPVISNPFVPAKTGMANTDINLRPEPGANNEPIGVVTKNSRLRIVKTQNNWYQVVVIEQGRERLTPLPTNRGWLYSRYVDLD